MSTSKPTGPRSGRRAAARGRASCSSPVWAIPWRRGRRSSTGLADRYRVIGFDNRGAGRTPLPDGELSVARMADDAAELLRALGVGAAHVVGFSGGSAIAQELALRRPAAVRSLVLTGTWARADAYLSNMTRFWHWLVAEAPDERAMLEAFFLWIYTPRAHADGTVQRVVDEALAFAHPQSATAFQRQLAAFARHDALDRLPGITAPTLVLAGEHDIATPPRLGRIVADAIPGARFEVLADRLADAGWRPGRGPVVLAANADAAAVAGLLRHRLPGAPRVVTTYLCAAGPAPADAVAALRAEGHRRVTVAPYLLGPGFFARRAAGAGACRTAAPLGAHDALARLVALRYDEALRPRAAACGRAATAR